MEASASDNTAKSAMRSSADLAADAEAGAAAGASSSAANARSSTAMARCMARAAAEAPTGPSTDLVDRLPAVLVQRIFLLLPVHDRMRCRAVSRAWRAALADRGCWRVLRFSGCGDLPRLRGNHDALAAFILAAGRAAGGAAEEIDVRGVPCDYGVLNRTLKQVAEENGGSLRVLRVSDTLACIPAAECSGCESCHAASWLEPGKLPHLEELEADVTALSVGDARRLLDGARQPDGRFKALRMRLLDIRADGVNSFTGEYETPEKEREVAESLAELLRTAAPGHPSLTGLTLFNMPLLHPGLMDAVADAAVACGLESLHLYGWHIDHTCLPALSRALRSGRLRSLVIYGMNVRWRAAGGARTLDGPRDIHEEFCAALRGSRLECLTLVGMRPWTDPHNGRALLAALTAHPTLHTLTISGDESGGAASKAAAAEAVAALLEANSPALESLRIGDCGLGAERLERILRALRGNTHLTALDCLQQNGVVRGVDEAFATRVVLPLLQVNTTLQTLKWDSYLCGAAGVQIDRIMETRARN